MTSRSTSASSCSRQNEADAQRVRVVSRIRIAPSFVGPLLQVISANAIRREDMLKKAQAPTPMSRPRNELRRRHTERPARPLGLWFHQMGPVACAPWQTLAWHWRSEHLFLPSPAPHDLRVTLEIGQEEESWWAHFPELDVSGEGDDLLQALAAVYGAAHEWLAYLRDESPELAPGLAEQARYVALLDAPGSSWFKDFRLAT